MLVGAKHTQSWLKSHRRRNEQIRENLVLNDSMEGKELVKLKQQHNCDYQV